MSAGLERVERYFQEFADKVEQCRDPSKSTMADIKEAHNHRPVGNLQTC
jgi:hypothetical protein